MSVLYPGTDLKPGSGQESSLQDTVLIAEDDPLFRRVLERCLQKWDYRVIALENGLEAWSVLQKKNAPQMAILDWMMPGLDGVELCRRIRNHQPGPYKYVLLLTAKGSKEDVVAVWKQGPMTISSNHSI